MLFLQITQSKTNSSVIRTSQGKGLELKAEGSSPDKRPVQPFWRFQETFNIRVVVKIMVPLWVP